MKQVAGLVLAAAMLAPGLAVAQDESPSPSSGQSPSPVESMVPPSSGSGVADLWLVKGAALTRVDGQTGEVLEVRDTSVDGCVVTNPDLNAVQPSDGTLWVMGTTKPGKKGVACFVAVPVDGSEVRAYPLSPTSGLDLTIDPYLGSSGSLGDGLAAVVNEKKSGGASTTTNALYQVAPETKRLREGVFGVGSSSGGLVGIYETKVKGKSRFEYGVFDVSSGDFRTIAKAQPGPVLFQAGPTGLVASRVIGGPAITVLDPAATAVVATLERPAVFQNAWAVAPTADGIFIAGEDKKGRAVLRFVPYDDSEPVALDACAGLTKKCTVDIAGWTDDAVWIMAGTYDFADSPWDYDTVIYRRYALGETEPSLEVPASTVLAAAA